MGLQNISILSQVVHVVGYSIFHLVKFSRCLNWST